MRIIKRNGSEEDFNIDKIINAVKKANGSGEHKFLTDEQIEDIADYVEYKCNKIKRAVSVEEIQDMVASGGLTGGHARALAGVDDDNEQLRFAKICIDKKLSVRQLEKMISNSESRSAKKGRTRDPEIKAAEEHLTKIVGGRVSLPSSRKKGKIEIHFSSPEQLDSIIEKLSELDEKEFE